MSKDRTLYKYRASWPRLFHSFRRTRPPVTQYKQHNQHSQALSITVAQRPWIRWQQDALLPVKVRFTLALSACVWPPLDTSFVEGSDKHSDRPAKRNALETQFYARASSSRRGTSIVQGPAHSMACTRFKVVQDGLSGIVRPRPPEAISSI